MANAQATREAFQNDPTDPRHGTQNGYTNLKCRCPRCRKCNAERSARNRAVKKRLGLPPGDPRHGTPTGWSNWCCTCFKCRRARAAADYRVNHATKRKAS